MKRFRPAFLTLAALLAVLLPLEQSHCAWMALGHYAPRSAGNAAHACCRHAAKAPASAPCAKCACIKIPVGSVPHFTFPRDAFAGVSNAPPAQASALAPVLATAAPAPPIDVGSPPLPIDLGAHGMRAPPRSA